MSAKATGIVWESALERPEKYVLLALADHAKDDGTDVYPSLWKIQWKTGYSETQVRGIMRSLMEKQILILVHKGGQRDGDVNKYRIDYKAIPMLTEFKDWSQEKRKAERAKAKGTETAPSGVRKPHPQEGTVQDEKRVQFPENEGTVATAPKPSTNRTKNYIEHGNEASSLPGIDLPEPPKKEKPQDPRFPEICDAIRKCWPKGEGYKCDITPADAGAINRMLANKHDWKAEELAVCIVARFMSASVNPTESVKSWIGAVTDYQSGPQEKHGRPMYTGTALNEWRNQARVILYGPQPEQLSLQEAKNSEAEYVVKIGGDVGAGARQLFESFREFMKERLDKKAYQRMILPLQFCCLTTTELQIMCPNEAHATGVSGSMEEMVQAWLPQQLKGVKFIWPESLKQGGWAMAVPA